MVFDTHRACLRTRFLSTLPSTVYVGATNLGAIPWYLFKLHKSTSTIVPSLRDAALHSRSRSDHRCWALSICVSS
jgi:hypothetical protein